MRETLLKRRKIFDVIGNKVISKELFQIYGEIIAHFFTNKETSPFTYCNFAIDLVNSSLLKIKIPPFKEVNIIEEHILETEL